MYVAHSTHWLAVRLPWVCVRQGGEALESMVQQSEALLAHLDMAEKARKVRATPL